MVNLFECLNVGDSPVGRGLQHVETDVYSGKVKEVLEDEILLESGEYLDSMFWHRYAVVDALK